MDLTTVRDVRQALQLAGLKPNKQLGQHFLVDRPSLDAMLAAAELSDTDTVVEIGPGLGVMTKELAERVGQLLAIETDAHLAELLRRWLPANATVLNQDILQFDARQLPEVYKVVANVPYNITSPILRWLMESPQPPQLACLLIQEEVAQRLVARPGAMSVLSMSVQYYAEVEYIQAVPRDKFWPSPKVDSAIVRLRRRSQPVFPADVKRLFRLVKAGFGERRKQLKNSLAGGLRLETADVLAWLHRAGIAPTARAQELSLEQWQALYDTWLEEGRS